VFLCKSDWNVTVEKQSQAPLTRCQAIDQLSQIKIKRESSELSMEWDLTFWAEMNWALS
jgi:hypothetical protein